MKNTTNIKDYYYTRIYPFLGFKALPIDRAEEIVLHKKTDSQWRAKVKEYFNRFRGQESHIYDFNTILNEYAAETITWFVREDAPEDHSFVDVAKIYTAGRIFVGEYPLNVLNAGICYVPEADAYLVLVNYGLVRFLDRMITLMLSFTCFADFSGGQPIEKTIKDTTYLTWDRAVRLMRQLAISYKYGQEYSAEVTNIKPSVELLGLKGRMLCSVTRFIIAHEFAHCSLGHLKTSQRLALRVPESEVTLNIMKASHEDEYAADLVATLAPIKKHIPEVLELKTVQLTIEQADLMLEVIEGPLFFFSFMEIIDHAVKEKSSSTHPNTSIRYQLIRKLYGNIFDPIFLKEFDMYRKVLEQVKESL